MSDRLKSAHEDAVAFETEARDQLAWIDRYEQQLKYAQALPEGRAALEKERARLNELRCEVEERRFVQNECVTHAEDILDNCHERAEQPMRTWLATLKSRWDELTAYAEQKDNKLTVQLEDLDAQDAAIEALLAYVAEKRQYLADRENEEPQTIEECER